ncbi:(2Fe-2S)-binding protein [Streptacidiphilus sp. PB12-B1b]|uniref:(2Fe-2S)-binding protein n=1 Tax=Streptacidiphilus sp. PB12-B1b TaxID=2705012 RepID=UPI0015FC328F|nr:(2Fe-2S)-binding protein [Streptacidiphilus sp. PB12-B1b]QMU75884.1 (2Fe-2S)-binding protein [Streptacidiphilus sp. PB12-B1b]
MYVCLCHAVTEQRVREEIAAGATTPRQVAGGCKAGTDCGSCVRRIQAMLGHEGARPCPTPRLAARLGLAVAASATGPAVDPAAETAAEAA